MGGLFQKHMANIVINNAEKGLIIDLCQKYTFQYGGTRPEHIGHIVYKDCDGNDHGVNMTWEEGGGNAYSIDICAIQYPQINNHIIDMGPQGPCEGPVCDFIVEQNGFPTDSASYNNIDTMGRILVTEIEINSNAVGVPIYVVAHVKGVFSNIDGLIMTPHQIEFIGTDSVKHQVLSLPQELWASQLTTGKDYQAAAFTPTSVGVFRLTFGIITSWLSEPQPNGSATIETMMGLSLESGATIATACPYYATNDVHFYTSSN